MYAISFLWLVYILYDMRIIFHPKDEVWEILDPGHNPDNHRTTRDGIDRIYDLTFRSMVFVTAACYYTDGYYRYLLRTKFRSFFGIIPKKKEKDVKREVHQTLVVSNLSVELLYVIL